MRGVKMLGLVVLLALIVAAFAVFDAGNFSSVGLPTGESGLIVVGLGCAGSSVLIEACDAGADVLLLERASGGGGTSANSGGLLYLGGGTPVQKATGFEDDPEEMFKFLVAASSPGAEEDKVRIFCEDSVEHFHWLEGQGVRFTPGGIRKGGSGFDVCFIHPKGSDEAPIGSEGGLVELVQAPAEVLEAFRAVADASA